MGEHTIAAVGELEPGDRLLVEVEGVSIGVFNVGGELVAYENRCLHQYGPVCAGSLSGRYHASFDPDELSTTIDWIQEGEILSCPWHGWEYDLNTGDCLADSTATLRSFDVGVVDDDVVVTI